MGETEKFKQAVRDLVKLKKIINKTPNSAKDIVGREEILAQNIIDQVFFYKKSANDWNPYFATVPMSVDDVTKWVGFPRFLNGVGEYIDHFKKEAEQEIINQIGHMACAFVKEDK